MPASKAIKPSLSLSKSDRQHLADAAQKFSLAARKLGTEYLINGNIGKISVRDSEIIGSVKIDHLYKVSWKNLGTSWQNHCTCSMGANCEHSYAVAHHVLQFGLEDAVSAASKPEENDAPDEKLDRLLSLVSHPAKAGSDSSYNHQKSIVVKVLESRNSWDALQHMPALLAQLGIKADPESKAWTTFVEVENPKKRSWLLARELLKHGEKLPPELEPYRSCENFEKEERKEKEENLLNSVHEWVQALPNHLQKVDRSIKIVWSWEGQPATFGPQINILVTGKKLKDSLRTLQQVKTFATDVLHDDHLFSQADAYFLRWLDARFQVLALKPDSGEPEQFASTDYALLEWLTTWGRSDRCTWEDGSPVKFEEKACHIVPEVHFVDKNGAQPESNSKLTPILDFTVELANGQKLPLKSVRLILPRQRQIEKQPVFIFADNAFHRVAGCPPVQMLESFLDIGKLQLTKERRTRVLPDLLRSFPRIAENSKGLIKYHSVRVLVSLSLLPSDWITITVHALSLNNECQWLFTSRGWIKESTKSKKGKPIPEEFLNVSAGEQQAEASATAIAPSENKEPTTEFLEEFPDPNATQPVQDWLQILEVENGMETGFDQDDTWWVSIDPKKIEPFLELWKQRPSGPEYWSNPAFRSLVNRSKQHLPRFKIQSSGMDWFTISAEWTNFVNQLSTKDLEQIKNSEEKFVKLSTGHWISKQEGEEIKSTLDTLAELGVDPAAQDPQKLSLWHVASGGQEAVAKLATLLETSEDFKQTKEFAELKKRLESFEGIPNVTLPGRLCADLRSYQMEGLKFLAYLASLRLGAILADDMGLGKTLQALAWLEHLRDAQGPAPSLVICPASVVYNWCREAQKFVKDSKVLLLTSGEERHALRKEIPKHDLVITNYALLRRDLSDLKQFEFRAIVLDEAQNIKNPDSRVAQAAKELNGIHRLALTGTPLENRLLDLWSIVDFVCPGYLSTRTKFSELYDVPDQPHRRRLLKSRLRPILLRRIKREVAPDLPDRIEERHDCELTEGQRKLYVSELNRVREFVKDIQAKDEFNQKKIHVLAALTRLRQICCHPELVGSENTVGSGKFDALFEIVEPLIAGGHKVLIFSQFVEMLSLLEKELINRTLPFHVLTGRTTKREAVVEAFQNDPNPCAFLLSLRAAGTGLNLTAASYVILYDPWWNPAVEAQAIDRTHRIGQDRTVITYRLVSKDTVEDKIFQLQESKSAMVKDVLGEEGFNRSLTKEDLDFIFSA